MLTAEPHKIIIDDSFIEHRFNTWDEISTGLRISEILDIKIGSNFHKAYQKYSLYCDKNRVDHSMIRVPADDEKLRKLMYVYGFANVETSYQIAGRVSKIKNISFDMLKKKTIGKECDLQELCLLSSNIFEYGRFSEDFFIGKEISNKRYNKWTKDLYQQNNERVFLFSKSNLIGFMFYENHKAETNLILGGLSKSYSYLCKDFWSYVFSKVPKENIIKTTVSANNIGVVNLYSSFGFKINRSLIGYHKKWSKK